MGAADTVLTLATSNLANTAVSTLAAELVSSAFEKAKKAKAAYDDSSKDLSQPLERNRQTLSKKLEAIQADVNVHVFNQALLLKLMHVLLEQTTRIYEAESEEDLKVAELHLDQVNDTVIQYRKLMERRAMARWLAVLVSILALLMLGGLIFWGYLPGGPTAETMLPVIQIPLPVFLWSAIGSFVAILYRFNNSGDIELQDPLRWLFTRPLTGIVMGTIAYLAVKVGLLAIVTSTPNVANPATLGTVEVLWLVGFIGGFSDRFADGLLRSLVGRFGGDPQEGLVELNYPPASPQLPAVVSLLKGLPGIGQRGNGQRDDSQPQNESGRSPLLDPESSTEKDAAQSDNTPAPNSQTKKLSEAEVESFLHENWAVIRAYLQQNKSLSVYADSEGDDD